MYGEGVNRIFLYALSSTPQSSEVHCFSSYYGSVINVILYVFCAQKAQKSTRFNCVGDMNVMTS